MDREAWRNIVRGVTEDAAVDQQQLHQSPCPPREDLTDEQTRGRLEEKYGMVWNSLELAKDYEVEAFCEDRVVVIRRSDGRRGTVRFLDKPRFYWGFTAG